MSVSLRRRWKDKFHTLGLLCKNQIGYLFVSSRDEDEFIPLRAFRRMKSEICARVEEDLFATGVELDPFAIEPWPLSNSLNSSPNILVSDKARNLLRPFKLSDEYTRFGNVILLHLPLLEWELISFNNGEGHL